MQRIVARLWGQTTRPQTQPEASPGSVEAGQPTNNNNNNNTNGSETPVSVARDPTNYGRNLYFGPRFIGAAEALEELGQTAWRRVSNINDNVTEQTGELNNINNISSSSKKTKAHSGAGCTEIYGQFNVRDIILVLQPSTDADAAPQYQLSFSVDALSAATVKVWWLARELPANDTSGTFGVLSSASSTAFLPAQHEKELAVGLEQTYTAPTEYWLSPDKLANPQALLLRAIPTDTEQQREPGAEGDTEENSAALAGQGTLQSALQRVASAISLSRDPESNPPTQEQQQQQQMPTAPEEQGDIQMSVVTPASDIPLIIAVEHVDGTQSLLTLATLTALPSGEQQSLTILSQKMRIKDQTYELEEVYGTQEDEEDTAESNDTAESRVCVVCISDPACVAVLPCRHLCLCADCAEELRHRSCFCPICRQAFHTMIRLGDD